MTTMRKFASVTLDEETILRAHKAAAEVPEGALHPKLSAILEQERPLQHTPEWFDMRLHMLTASNVASYLGLNKYCSRKRFLKRIYEDLNKPPGSKVSTPSHGFAACLWGSKYEQEAAVLYQLLTGNQCYPHDVGLVVHPQHKFLGASPDRVLVDRPILVEIKAPFKRVIEPTEIPPMYIPQVQAQLQVCDMDECHFVQFKPATLCSPGIISVLVVSRDEEWWRKNINEISKFAGELEQMEPTEPAHKRTKTTPPTTPTSPVPCVLSSTMSAGLYDIFIDERIQPSSFLLEHQQ
jgi:putative phage-type endonuclease